MSQIYGPNGAPVLDLSLERAEIGGTPIDYQPRPDIGVTFSADGFGVEGLQVGGPVGPTKVVYVLTKPENLLNLLAAYNNINSAVIRELLTLRKRVEELEAQTSAQAETARLSADESEAQAG